ncbi:carbon storage regulator CsrA [Desulfobotulus alkaliphilus]|uniref:Translational regulator CsrA n=1 Tax=Desulfobotulus alkaliphilus TaxID=622671 RepID=A0A562RTZ6_9BACT|nr:carbon storage regulator CsrA [Desulfobotulus alkaliphilus]TWI72383.1 carbon storage regulator CsrA [Desulfobotulus alkaliphilus]
MLILTRKAGEQIRIGDDITIQVLDLGKGGVKLGIRAPKNIAIHREEVFERVRQCNLAAMEDVRIRPMDAALRLWKERMKKAENNHLESGGSDAD